MQYSLERVLDFSFYFGLLFHVRFPLFRIPTDILNTLQGFIIFLLLVVTRKRVRKLLAKKKPCGIVFPKSWTAYKDEEYEIVLPEELELSQQETMIIIHL